MRAPSPKRQVEHAAGHLVRLKDLGNQFELLHALANRDIELVRVHDTGEVAAGPLSGGGLREEVLVLAEQHAAERRGAIE